MKNTVYLNKDNPLLPGLPFCDIVLRIESNQTQNPPLNSVSTQLINFMVRGIQLHNKTRILQIMGPCNVILFTSIYFLNEPGL